MRLVTTKYQLICNTVFIVFWVMATYNFLVQEIMGAEVPAVELGVRLMCQGVLVLLGLWTLRSRTDILIISAFCVLSLVGTWIVNNQQFIVWVDGLRLYIGFLFVAPVIRYLLADEQFREWFIARLDKTLYRFLWIQIPCILWQAEKYPHPDFAGGSLGWMMSGVVSNMIYLCSFYLMLRRWDSTKNYLVNLKDNAVLIFLLLPSFLNETKVSFLLLFMYFFFLIPMNRKFLKNLLWIAPLMFASMSGALYLYTQMTGSNEQITDMAVASTYLVGDEAALNLVEGIMENKYDNEEEADFARGLKLAITPAIMNRNPPSWYVGYGVGQYKIGESAKKVEFAKQYQWLLKGTMMQGHVVWIELGLIGIGLYFLYWFVLLKSFKRVPTRNKQLQSFIVVNVLIFTCYNAPMIVIPFYILFIAFAIISTVWDTLPKYNRPRLFGSREIRWSLKTKEANAL